MTEPKPYLTLADLAARWCRSKPVARQVTRTRGFPAPLTLSARTLLWPTAEVEAWENQARQPEPVRRAVPVDTPVHEPRIYRAGAA